MELKELKKEVESLGRIDKTLAAFKDSWLKQIKPNSNQQYPFLTDLDEKTKKEINLRLATFHQALDQLSYARFTQEKLASLAQYLIELKLASLNGDTAKPKIIYNKLVKDDFLNLNLITAELSQFEFNLHLLEDIYIQTNQILCRELPLEHSVALMDAPHKNHLNSLLFTCKKQKELLEKMKGQFLALAGSQKI